jgi:hypothetical protein
MAIVNNLKDFPESGDIVDCVNIWDTHGMDNVAEIFFKSGRSIAFHFFVESEEKMCEEAEEEK